MTTRRTLLVTERTVAHGERDAYLQSLPQTRARCADAQVQFWVFEHAEQGSRFIEFAEAKDESSLEALALNESSASRWHAVEIA